MTTLEHLNCERESHGLLSRKRLPHIFPVRQEFLARHESTLPLGLSLFIKENWQGANLFLVEENEIFSRACARFLA
jgi:hypothetical protein